MCLYKLLVITDDNTDSNSSTIIEILWQVHEDPPDVNLTTWNNSEDNYNTANNYMLMLMAAL